MIQIHPNRQQSKRLDSIQNWLRRHGACIAAAVARLGEVSFSDRTETACIQILDRDVELFFNARFFDELQTPEVAAVLIHEAMHFVFKHIQRVAKIRDPWERRLFMYAAEAVINDVIVEYFPYCVLPGSPITGKGLVGRSVANLSADQVMRMLRDELDRQPAFELKMIGLHDTDDHSQLLDGTGDGWTTGTDALLLDIVNRHGKNDVYGSSAVGGARLFERSRPVRSLSGFLRAQIKPTLRFQTLWTRPNRKATSVYPDVVLPVYEPDPARQNILMAVDTSGSISRQFLGCAISMAETPLPGSRIELLTFDTVAYPYKKGDKTARGGGGTKIQAVEEYIQEQGDDYPDVVFVFTDGYSPKPVVQHPDRWTWILEPRGSIHAVPDGSKVERFQKEDIH